MTDSFSEASRSTDISVGDEEEKAQLLQDYSEEIEENNVKLTWAHQQNRWFPRISNRTFCLLSCVSASIILLLTLVPIIFLVIIPQTVKAFIDNAPPAYINVLDIQTVYPNNGSIGLWFQADLDLKVPFVYAYPAAYEVSLLYPNNAEPELKLGLMDLGSFESSTSGINLDFFTLVHNVDVDNMRKMFLLAAKHLEKQFGSKNELLRVQSRVPQSIYRLHLQSKTYISFLGIKFPKVMLKYDVGLNFKTSDFLKRFQPKLERCVVKVPFLREPMKCADFFDDSTTLELASATNNFQVELELSVVNPSVFGLNLGHVEIDVHAGNYHLATIEIPNLQVKQTKRKTDVRQNLVGTMKNLNITTSKNVFDDWHKNMASIISIAPGAFKFYGYNGVDKVNGRVLWLEKILSDFALNLSIPKPSFLIK